ncbi:hypothetical protein MSMTP_1586 [Methanosarcina sp. MTP4]|uniref:hypothetical protein n=1 Tax=Methanosarcina sp. MTP4 TaxID=1434100 RepID=UPI000615E73F|nr:hypothetical protein [Methanosarcina sp. MTP4]AKB25055.1 hypothetical protein MSMTP_1586 [Methanosarcina sp. MTP4]
MLDIFKSMMKEEWRMHSSLFGHSGFALFPVFIFLFTFFVSLVLPVFRVIVTDKGIALGMHYLFLLVGGMVGAFGLMGREFMNRRFGQASLITYSSRTLPVSERVVFLNFLVKDVVYYFFLYVLPFVAGFALAVKFVLPSAAESFKIPLLTLTLSLSFMIGLSVVFFLSTVYAHSGKAVLAGLLLAFPALLFASGNFNGETLYALPALAFYLVPSQTRQLLVSAFLVLVPSALSLIFLKVDYPQVQKSFSNSFSGLSSRFGSYRYAAFVAKDFLDLKRSEGGLGKIIFSFLLPATLVWVLLSALGNVIPALDSLLLFSLVLGVLSSSMYNWLTEFDLFSSYAFLPLKVSDVIKSKLDSYAFLNVVPFVFLFGLGLRTAPYTLVPSLLVFLSISFYMVTVLVYLTGLYPSVNLYNGKTFALYALSIVPVLILNIVLSILGPYYLLADLALVPVAVSLLGRSFRKWDGLENPQF